MEGISSKENIVSFFTDVIRRYNIVLFPDIPFDEYEDENEDRKFTSEEAKALDEKMIACFDYCEENDLDVYELAGEAQVIVYKEKGLLPKEFGE